MVIKPQKVEETLAKKACTRAWYQEPVNLAEDGIVGPFNFTPIDGETHRISEDAWKAVEASECVKNGGVDIDDLSQINPLQ